MTLSRRTAMKAIASVGALLAAPFQKAFAGLSAPASPKSLLDHVQAKIDALPQQVIGAQLDGTYAKVFKHCPSTMQVEQTVHVRYLGLSDLKGGVTRIDDRMDHIGQRFVYCAETYELGFAFAVVPDDDPRAGNPPASHLLKLPHGHTIMRPGIVGLAQMKEAACQPWRASDLPVALSVLMGVFKDAREHDAAHVLNTATTYDPSIAGDGVSLCSPNHPWDEGFWANTFRSPETPTPPFARDTAYRPLDADSLKAACEGVGAFIDDAGLRIAVRPVRLIVAADLAETAKRLTNSQLPYLVWNELTPGSWFVQTSVDGLTWFERRPFELGVWKDHATGMVIVKGYERRCFQYRDPRAVFGVVPPRFKPDVRL